MRAAKKKTTRQLYQTAKRPLLLVNLKISESRLKSIIDARRQPKPFDEESKVAEKYASMSVEDRAFAILYDLGLIENNVDPRDPNYDHSSDDEICEHSNTPRD
mmetsp:Transcript_8557/g.14984  ORF Transcript_8557/g.14984 Transcript_8557/m.14984 type:complete len:103 (-) Transcript_8557:45-353(-)